MTYQHEVTPENAPRFLEWIKDRGGIAVWRSIDLSDPNYLLSTPALTDGRPTKQPHWKVGNEPTFVITEANEISVTGYEEIKRFHVGLRRGSNGFKIKLTDAASRRVRREVDKAGDGATYEFDYEAQEAVILKPEGEVSLAEWKASQ